MALALPPDGRMLEMKAEVGEKAILPMAVRSAVVGASGVEIVSYFVAGCDQ